jgi:hypothetical protein
MARSSNTSACRAAAARIADSTTPIPKPISPDVLRMYSKYACFSLHNHTVRVYKPTYVQHELPANECACNTVIHADRLPYSDIS